MAFNIAIVGATGLVGRMFLKILEERNFPVKSIRLFASERSAGSSIDFKNEKIIVEKLEQNCFKGTDIALFSAGGAIAKEWAKISTFSNCIVIDNSSYWRMFPEVPLVVPEVNPEAIKNHNGIIANPNCSTIQLVVALKPISDAFGLKRVLVSLINNKWSWAKGINQLNAEMNNIEISNPVSKYRVANNLIFHNFDFSNDCCGRS